ncbi:MAG: uroporphyrinogen decarboxylase family protein [Eubacteriales bacterium]|jgi:uroporphyrinogen decarboxylase
MTSKQRIITAARGGRPDCVPAAPYIGNYGAAVAGVPISLYNTDGKRMAEAQAKAWELLKLDVVVPQSDNYYLAQAFGVEIHQPENDTPHVTKTAIQSLDEVDNLPDTIDPYSQGRMPVFLEAVSRLKEIFGDEVAIRTCGTGMFSLAGHMLGTQNFLTEMAIAEADEDEAAQKKIMQLMERMTQALITFSTAAVKAGATIIVCGDSSASPDLVSPHYYEKYIFPFEKKYFTAMGPICEEYDAVRLLHICGNTTPILPLMAKTGADIVEIDHKVDLAKARQLAGDHVCLMGNLDPTVVLLQGTPDLVARESEKAIEAAGKQGAFILGSGCEVPIQSPVDNILAVRDTAHRYRY